ncbi:MAG TPA: hypothetical protein VF594_04415, partial [Rubricoccaceae bacterium]
LDAAATERFNLPGGEEATGREITQRVQALTEATTERLYREWVRPDAAAWQGLFVGIRTADGKRGPVRFETDAYGNAVPVGIDAKATLARMQRRLVQTGEVPRIGVDGLAALMHAMETEGLAITGSRGEETTLATLRAEGRHAEADEHEVRLATTDRPFPATGYQRGYWPHLGFSPKDVERHVAERLGQLQREGAPPEETKALEGRLRAMFARGQTGSPTELAGLMGGRPEDEAAVERLLLAEPVGTRTDAVEWAGTRERAGNLRARSDEGSMPGWSKKSGALDEYEARLVSGYHRRLGALLNKVVIDGFERRGAFGADGDEGATTKSWARFLRLKARDILGYPAYQPREYLDDPNLGLRGGKANPVTGNVYNLFTEDAVERRARWVDGKLLGGRWFGKESAAAVQAGNVDGLIADARGQRFADKVAAFSRLEAKWAMLSLLARPRGYVYNLTQHANTLVSTGYTPFRNALSIDYLQRHVSPELDSRDKVNRWVEGHGVVPTLMAGETGSVPGERQAQWEAFRRDAGAMISAKMKRGGEVSDETMKELATRHGVFDLAEQFGSAFMRASERQLRVTSFVAHYLKAREVMEANGLGQGEGFAVDDPVLIEHAKRGVVATQFVYSAAEKPMMASTGLGRVFFRFQQWSWQSVAFQRRVM